MRKRISKDEGVYMKILFLHGWTSTLGGRKPTFLKEHGHEVINPALPDDFHEAVHIAQAEYDKHNPDVVVGSSRGGAVAVNIDSKDTPIVLLCPAWKKWGSATTVKPNTIILHSRQDDVVPFPDSEELIRNSGLPPESLIEVGNDHRLAASEPLRAMLEACERLMTDETAEQATIRESIQKVLSRIRRTAARREKTELPTADFSNALNAIGENFVDLLFATERRGQWWLDETGQFHECIVRRVGERSPRIFARGVSPEWNWYPEAASRLADPMTGPDHIVRVSVPSLEFDGSVCLEQKLRFGSRRDAFAGASTYLKHLLHRLDCPRPSEKEFNLDSYFNGILEAAKAVLCRTKKNGALAYSGSVPQVCFVSTGLQPNRVVVTDKAGDSKVECEYIGFLAPTINTNELAGTSPALRIVQRAKVRLWIGLDSLLEACTNEEVEAAWSTAVAQLTEDICNPNWRMYEN